MEKKYSIKGMAQLGSYLRGRNWIRYFITYDERNPSSIKHLNIKIKH